MRVPEYKPCCAGGYFFGTFPSGKRVQEVIHRGGKWPLFKAPMLELKALWKGDASTFGSAYNCAIGDTVTAGKALCIGLASAHDILYCQTYDRKQVQAGLLPMIPHQGHQRCLSRTCGWGLTALFDKTFKCCRPRAGGRLL